MEIPDTVEVQARESQPVGTEVYNEDTGEVFKVLSCEQFHDTIMFTLILRKERTLH